MDKKFGKGCRGITGQTGQTLECVYRNELPDEAEAAKGIRQQHKASFRDDEVAQMIVDYTERHMTVYQLAMKYGCHRTTVSKVLKGNDVNVTIRLMDDEQVKEATRLYATGLSLREIGKLMGVCKTTVKYHLVGVGVEMREAKRYPRQHAMGN